MLPNSKIELKVAALSLAMPNLAMICLPIPAARGLPENPRKDESLVTYCQWLVAAFGA
jgi:hypothetical protein